MLLYNIFLLSRASRFSHFLFVIPSKKWQFNIIIIMKTKIYLQVYITNTYSTSARSSLWERYVVSYIGKFNIAYLWGKVSLSVPIGIVPYREVNFVLPTVFAATFLPKTSYVKRLSHIGSDTYREVSLYIYNKII